MAIIGDVLALRQVGTRVLAGTGNAARVYSSTDNGQTWTLLATLGSGSDRVNAFVVHPTTGHVFAAVSGSSAASGVWRSTNLGSSWSRVKTHPAGTGYNDVTITYGSGVVFAAGNAVSSSSQSPIARGAKVAESDPDLTWTDVPVSHYNYSVKSIVSTMENYQTPYAGDLDSRINPYSFYGTDSFYTIAGRITQNTHPTTGQQVYPTSSGAMGNGGLDMVAFLLKDSQGRLRDRALWAVRSHLNTADTEIWQWPATPNGPFNFAKIATISGKTFNVLYVDTTPSRNNPQRTIWAGANGEIWVSYNSGLTWAVATTAPAGQIYSFVRTTSNILIAGGGSGEIFRFGTGGSEGGGITPPPDEEEEEPTPSTPPESAVVSTTRILGREATCENEVYVANKFAFSNVTHIFHYNGSTYDNLQFEDVPPFDLLGTSPTNNKAVYFGSRTTDADVPGGTFSSLVFDITQAAENITVVWEYWNGATWTSLIAQDGTDQFRILGVNSVHWLVPSNWVVTAVNSVTGYWVRARVSTGSGTRVGPIHDNRYIYTSLLPCVDIAAGQVFGDLPAIARVNWTNRGDDIGSLVNLQIDRLVCGLKSVDRGVNFNAYLNISDVQPLFGVTVSKDSGSTWQSTLKAPTGRSLTTSYSSSGNLNVWKNLVSFSLSTTVAKDFYGHYRPFLRCHKVGATALDWQLRLRITFGSGGGSKEGTPVFPTAQSDWEVLDLREVAIPTTQVSNQSGNLGDQLQITVQGKCSALSSQLVLYDLILIPTDEWAVDTKPPELNTLIASEVRGTYYMDIDSITNPKAMLVALNRNSADQIISRYQAIGNGPAILQTGRDQRLWFLAMSYENFWRGYPEIAGTVQVFKKQRYLGLRGTT